MGSDFRSLADSVDEAVGAELTQLVRMKFTTSVRSRSDRRQAKLGMMNCAGVRAVRGVCEPARTMAISDLGSFASTIGLPASAGTTPSKPAILSCLRTIG